MKVTIFTVPPGGGETDFQFELELPAVPNVDDVVQVMHDEGDIGYEYFQVRRRLFILKVQECKDRNVFTYDAVGVEVEPVIGHSPNKAHKKSMEIAQRKGLPVKELPVSGYWRSFWGTVRNEPMQAEKLRAELVAKWELAG